MVAMGGYDSPITLHEPALCVIRVRGTLSSDWSDQLEEHWSGHALGRAGRLVFGRVNFEFMKGFWGSAETDPESARGSP